MFSPLLWEILILNSQQQLLINLGRDYRMENSQLTLKLWESANRRCLRKAYSKTVIYSNEVRYSQWETTKSLSKRLIVSLPCFKIAPPMMKVNSSLLKPGRALSFRTGDCCRVATTICRLLKRIASEWYRSLVLVGDHSNHQSLNDSLWSVRDIIRDLLYIRGSPLNYSYIYK